MRIRRFATLVLAMLSITLLVATPAYASAIKQKGGTSTQPVTTGNDVSWPQCIKLGSLPSNQAFGIVGVNNGTSNTTNPCFAQELGWARKSTGVAGQPRVSLYVNTSNPGDITPVVADWPTSNFDVTEPNIPDIDPYGACRGADDLACSWQYGYNEANLDATTRGVPAPSSYRWYLDVETTNSWSNNTARNAADLEGMVNYFNNIGVTVGLYSTYNEWKEIVGSAHGKRKDADNNALNNLPSWVPGAQDEASAEAGCKLQPFTEGGYVVLSQYLSQQADLDFDVSCS